MSNNMRINQPALQTAYDSLANAFHWSSSPEGDAYWASVARELISLGAVYKPSKYQPVYSTDVNLCVDVLAALSAAFVWKRSPQGIAYWREVSDKISRIMSHANTGAGTVPDPAADSKYTPDKAYDRAMKGIV